MRRVVPILQTGEREINMKGDSRKETNMRSIKNYVIICKSKVSTGYIAVPAAKPLYLSFFFLFGFPVGFLSLLVSVLFPVSLSAIFTQTVPPRATKHAT